MTPSTAITNAQSKLFASLASAKGRSKSGLFMAQGAKCVHDTIAAFSLHALVCQVGSVSDPLIAEIIALADVEPLWARREDMVKISTLATAPAIIAVYHIPAPDHVLPQSDSLCLALDCVQDPGNLGTIMRLCDWMGIEHIFASTDTADVFNPKVVQATMGAIARVKVHYCNLPEILSQANGNMPVYGTFLDGNNIYKSNLEPRGIIVMGNEGNGISPQVAACVSHRLLIPSYPPSRVTSESLNVAIAAAITISEFRRNG